MIRMISKDVLRGSCKQGTINVYKKRDGGAHIHIETDDEHTLDIVVSSSNPEMLAALDTFAGWRFDGPSVGVLA